MAVTIDLLDAAAAEAALPALIALLDDAVQGGASVGFVLPLAEGELAAYWAGVVAAVARGARVLLVARADGRIVGTVQVALEPRASQQHRAEIQKLLVLRAARGQGIGAALMAAAEVAAGAAGRTLLVLDTRTGDAAERLYYRRGWHLAGIIPRFARSTDRQRLEDCSFMYKELDGAG